MRNTKQRVAAVKRRTAEIERKKKSQRGRIVGISSVAASLLIIAGLSFVMPSVMERLSCDYYPHFGLTASIFDTGEGLGYLMIGLLSFVLGVCITVLCYRFRLKNSETEKEQKKQEDNDDRAD